MAHIDNSLLTAAMEQFSKLADVTKGHAGEILNLISSGLVPSKSQIQEFDSDIEELQKHYDVILKSAKEYLGESEMPEAITVSALVDAVEQKQKKSLEKKLLASCLLLQRFISVKSYLETYTQALEPYQKQAELLLSDIDNGNLDAIDNSPVLESSALFMEALTMENYESKEGLSVLESLEKHFPIKVQLGIARRQYYIDDPKAESKKEAIEEQAEENNQSPVSIEEAAKRPIAEGHVDSEEPAAEILEEVVEERAETPVTPKEDTPLSAKEEASSGVEDVPQEESHPLQSINKVKKATPSASAFKKEISKLPKDAFTLLPLFTNLGALTGLQAFKFGVAMSCFVDDDISFSSVKNSLKTLCNKNLLSSFDLDGEIVYCLTSYCSGCLRKETIQQSKLFDVSFGKYSIVSDSTVEYKRLKRVIQYNSLLLCYFYGIKEQTSQEDYQSIKTSLVMKDDYYRIGVWFAGSFFPCVLDDGSENLPDAENLLVVGDGVDSKYVANYDIVFLYTQGRIVRFPDDGSTEGNGEQQNELMPESASDEPEENAKKTAEEAVVEASDNVGSGVLADEVHTSEHEVHKVITAPQIENVESDSSGPSLSEIIEKKTAPDDDGFCSLIEDISSGRFIPGGTLSNVVRATTLAKAASLNKANVKSTRLLQKLLLATHLPLGTCQYTSGAVTDAISDCDDEYIKLAIYMQALLTPASSYDFMLYQMADESFKWFDTEFPSSGNVKALFNKLLAIHEVLPMGFSGPIMALLGDATARRQYSEMLQSRARNLLTLPNIKTRIKNLTTLYNKCFGVGSELYDCIKSIADNKVDEYGWVRDVLTQFCDEKNGELSISEENIATILDTTWAEVNSKNYFTLEYGARDKILREFDSRLLLMKSWVEHIDQSYDGKLDVNRINVLKKEIITLTAAASQKMTNASDGFSSVLKYALWFIQSYLSDPGSTNDIFEEFQYTGIFSMDDDKIPVIDASTANIKYYEPWRRVLKHIVSPIQTSAQARSAIVDEVGSELFDNLHQLILLNQADPDKGTQLTETQVKTAKEAAEDRTKKFRENLELAYTYNRISEPEKEKLATIMEEYKPKFFEVMDFGCWSQFLDALERTISELADEKKKALRRELDARKQTLGEGETSTILDEAEMLLEDAMNFAVTEEYFNRFDNGEREFSADLYALLHEEDSFATFLSDDVFRPLQQECEKNSGRALKTFAWNYLEPRVPRNWSVRQKDDSRKLVENWPTRKGAPTTITITALFSGLGFSVKKAERGSGKKEEFFKLEIEPTAKSMADYRHPISLFGTQMKSPLNVVVLYGNYAPKQLVDTITGLDFGGMTVVLIDRPIDRASRRQVGEIFHTQTSGQNPFILIDQVLILHLAMHQVTERLPVMLKCTLPYTSYQPFVRDGGSTADEMFCGRSKELGTIIDPNGASVVYGGRQLGKTALLQRAESRCSNPANKKYAVYCNIIDCGSEEDLVSKVTEDLLRKTNLAIGKTSTISDFCKQLDKLFRTNKVQSMLLLLDEADRFLGAIADTRYKQLQPLIDLKRETTNRFKFVLAGLHNVCRAKNATSENGVFGQLGTPLCVKPLSPTDALQLLSRPLKYLGLEIDRYPHLETILTNTNYYPGILQFFGYNLVEAFTTQYGRYYRAVDGNPPFTLQDDQLGAVMNDADLNRSIRDKFRWSLELDPRYFMIARCITILYYLRDEDTENWLGFSVEEIMGIAEDYSIHCLEACGKTDYVNLLDEMVEMGILSKPSAGLYRLRRNSFVNIIGADFDSLDADIINNNTEVVS